MIKILIADDHPIFRAGLRQVLEKNERCQIVHESDDGDDALRFLSQNEIDVAVLDIQMPGLNGLVLARTLKEKKLPVRVIILTMHKQEDMVDEAFKLGVQGYVLKENAVLDILQAVNAVMQGEYYISPQISSYIIKQAKKEQIVRPEFPALKELTDTERKVLKLISMNQTSKDIGDELHISSRTVDNHRTNICAKLALHGPHKLLLFALENKDKL
ncbi:MAG: response regulator transcription factor [Ignavibacteriales bacterium]|nr:response regulator transcription factor [Ignavibacteriales bacterium]